MIFRRSIIRSPRRMGQHRLRWQTDRLPNRRDWAGLCSSDPVGNREAVEVEGRAKVGAGRCLLGLERDAGRVGHSVDRVEEADHTRRVGQPRWTQRRHQRVAGSRERRSVVAEHGFGKRHEEPAMRHAATALWAAGDRREIESLVVSPAARTEQQGMTGGSIETSVERRDARRQQLDLSVADRPVLAREIAHHFAGQVLVGHQVEKAADFGGY